MSIRYATTIKDINNKGYVIGIYDKSYSGSIISDFNVGPNGFELKYDGGDKNYSPIIGSELTLNIILKKDNTRDDTNLFTFLKSIINQNSQLYYIVIREEVSGDYVDFWTGNVVQNQSSWANDALESGLEFTLIANDFGYLKNKVYAPVTNIANSYTLTELLYQALLYMNCWDLKQGTSVFLSHNINWFEKRLSGKPNINVLDLVNAVGTNFFELNDETQENSIYFIEIVKTIASVFGCKIIQSAGRFWLIQYQNYANASVLFRTKSYNNLNETTGNINTRLTVDNATSNDLKILAGAMYSPERPFKSVQINKPRGNNIAQTLTKSTVNSNEAVLNISPGLFFGGGNNKLGIDVNFINKTVSTQLVNGSWSNQLTVDGFQYSNNAPSGTQNLSAYNYIRTIPISIGVRSPGNTWRYVQKVGNNLIWTISSTPIYISIVIPGSGSVLNVLRFFNNSFVTPPLPTATFDQITVRARVRFDFPPNVTNPDYYLGHFTGELTARFLENGTSQAEETTFLASISPQPFDSIAETLENVLLYDNGLPSLKGNMTIPIFGFTLSWNIGNGTIDFSILELVVINAIAMNSSVKEVLQAQIKGNYYPHINLRYDNKNWHLKQATFNATDNIWTGEWYELQYDDSTVDHGVITNNGNPPT